MELSSLVQRAIKHQDFAELVRQHRKLHSELISVHRDLDKIADQGVKQRLEATLTSHYAAINKLAEAFAGHGIAVNHVAGRDGLVHLKELIDVHYGEWERLQHSYFGLAGKTASWLERLSGGALMWSAVQAAYRNIRDAQATQLTTTGTITGGFADLAEDAERYSQVRNVISSTATEYGRDGERVDTITRDFVRLAGPDPEKARSVFQRLAAIARISNTSLQEEWERVSERQKRYGGSLEATVAAEAEVAGTIDATTASMQAAADRSGVEGTASHIMRQDFARIIHSTTDAIEAASGYANATFVAKMAGAAVEQGNALKLSIEQTSTLAHGYAQVLNLGDFVNYQIGSEVIRQLEAEITHRAATLPAADRQRAVDALLRERFGEAQLASVKGILDLGAHGGFVSASRAMTRLYISTQSGSEYVLRHNLELLKRSSDIFGVQMLEEAGMSRAGAVSLLVKIKAGDISQLQQEQVTILQANAMTDASQHLTHAMTESLIQGARNVAGDYVAELLRVVGDPLVKFAAGLAITAFSFQKEIKTGWQIVKNWTTLAQSYVKWAGVGAEQAVAGALSARSTATGKGLRGLVSLGVKAAVLGAAAFGIEHMLTKATVKPSDQEASVKGEAVQTVERSASASNPDLGPALQTLRAGDYRPDAALMRAISSGPALTPNATGVQDGVARDAVLRRDALVRHATITALGGRIEQRQDGGERVLLTVPGFMQSTVHHDRG